MSVGGQGVLRDYLTRKQLVALPLPSMLKTKNDI